MKAPLHTRVFCCLPSERCSELIPYVCSLILSNVKGKLRLEMRLIRLTLLFDSVG